MWFLLVSLQLTILYTASQIYSFQSITVNHTTSVLLQTLLTVKDTVSLFGCFWPPLRNLIILYTPFPFPYLQCISQPYNLYNTPSNLIINHTISLPLHSIQSYSLNSVPVSSYSHAIPVSTTPIVKTNHCASNKSKPTQGPSTTPCPPPNPTPTVPMSCSTKCFLIERLHWPVTGKR